MYYFYCGCTGGFWITEDTYEFEDELETCETCGDYICTRLASGETALEALKELALSAWGCGYLDEAKRICVEMGYLTKEECDTVHEEDWGEY